MNLWWSSVIATSMKHPFTFAENTVRWNEGDRMWNSNFLKEIFSKPSFLASFSLDVKECTLYNLGKRWWMGRHTLNSQNPLARNWVSRLIFLQKTTWPTTHIKYLVRNWRSGAYIRIVLSKQRTISGNTTRIPNNTYHMSHLLPLIHITYHIFRLDVAYDPLVKHWLPTNIPYPLVKVVFNIHGSGKVPWWSWV